MVTVMLYGRELGMSPIQSLQHIYVVNDMPALDFQTLQAMVRRNGRGFVAMWPKKVSSTEAVYHIERHDGPVKQEYDAVFTIEDAKRMGLGYYRDGSPIPTSPWHTQTDVLLCRRAGCKAIRELCGDLIGGFYSLDEAGIAVAPGELEVPVLTEEGEPVIERLVLPPEAAAEAEALDGEVEAVQESNADGPASPEYLASFKKAVRTFCEQAGVVAADVNAFLNARLADMGLSSSSEATALQLDVLYDQLAREYS